jgi:GT2 family glycosyltransferase
LSHPSVYVSILNWNRPELTVGCLDSLQRIDYQDVKLLVVDNGSRDDSVKRIHAAFPSVEIICSETNLGFAGGHGLAKDRALADEADLLWMLNNDVLVYPDTLSALVDANHRHGEALLGSLTLKPEDPSRISFGGGRELDELGRPITSQQYNHLGGKPYDPEIPDRIVEDINGSSFMVPLSVIRRNGFMDESFFLYGEETDYCYRMRAIGIPSIMVTQSKILHYLRGSTKGNARLVLVRRYYKRRSELVLAKRYWKESYHQEAMKEIRLCLKYRLKYLRHPRAWRDSLERYVCMGVWDALLNRMGKTLDPEDFLE